MSNTVFDVSGEGFDSFEVREGISQFTEGLLEAPQYDSYDGKYGFSRKGKVVQFCLPGEGGEEAEVFEVDKVGRTTNYALRIDEYSEAESTLAQLLKFVVEKGRSPDKIIYKSLDIEYQKGQPCIVGDEKSVEFPFSKVEAVVLKTARNLLPAYADMSLAEIGKALIEKEGIN